MNNPHMYAKIWCINICRFFTFPLANLTQFFTYMLYCNENSIYVFMWPQSKFSHSCVCERFIYSQYRSTYFSCSRIGRPMVGIYQITHRHMNVYCRIWDWGCAIPFLGIFVSNFRYCLFAVYTMNAAWENVIIIDPLRCPEYMSL
jgi:hypothetical protein